MKELEQPLISIIVPVYKVEKYLKRCVDIVRKLYPKQSAKQIVKMLLIKAKIMGV